MMIISRNTYPVLVLHRIPTSGELEHLRRFMIRYKADHPKAKKWEIRKATEIEFNRKTKYLKPVMEPSYARKKKNWKITINAG